MLTQAQELIFDRYKHPQHAGILEDATYKAEGANPVCGDELIFFLKTAGETVVAATHQTRACAICTASADLLAEDLIGKLLSDLQELSNEDITGWLDIPLSPLRLKCALLPLETARLALR